MVIDRTEVRRWEMFSDMFNSLCILVSNPTGQGRWPYKNVSKICSLIILKLCIFGYQSNELQ